MIYLDHAATSWPKPEVVPAAMQRWFTDVGVSASRGAGDRCQVAARTVATARAALAHRCSSDPAHVAFTSGATESLNLVLRALLHPGAAVVTTAFEHSSVVRPLAALASERNLRLEVLPPHGDRGIDLAAVRSAFAHHRPSALVCTHASNVTGAVLPAAELCALAREHRVLSVLDVSQTAGWLDLRVGADVLCGSAHKALLGPPGLGFVAHRGLQLPAQKQGGTGSSVALAQHPDHWPDAFEAGTPNTPAIFGLEAALAARSEATERRELAATLATLDAFAARLEAMDGFRVHAAKTAERTPVLSFTHARLDPAEIGAILAGADVHVRTGHHCAPWLHEHLGTAAAGTVRVSIGPNTAAAELDFVADLLAGL
ncbi:MAG: aminotransferase class V-fold PLP-dependent enzyme [Planctomycetes bacterium]|nr:aminotransferase class V-fold PLP-dependent enzyme [Planctomycetota bacterium]